MILKPREQNAVCTIFYCASNAILDYKIQAQSFCALVKKHASVLMKRFDWQLKLCLVKSCRFTSCLIIFNSDNLSVVQWSVFLSFRSLID